MHVDRSLFRKIFAAGLTVGVVGLSRAPVFADSQIPAADATAVLAGGCFWGMEEVFSSLRGVDDVTVGYSGGAAATAHYDMVSEGNTGHAESIRIRYNPQVISYRQLLQVYFHVAHDPTQLNAQAPDTGTQYRSEIFYLDATQRQIAQSTIAHLQTAHQFSAPIVTTVEKFHAFYPAEAYHQHFAERNPDNPYIVAVDQPRMKKLQEDFPSLLKR